MEDQEQRPRRWGGRKVLVTGGTGFLGTALIERLDAEGAQIAIINRDGYDPALPFYAEGTCHKVRAVIGGDLCNFSVCQRAVVETKPDVIFHLAAVSQVGWCREMPLEAIQTHVLGTANLLEACRLLAYHRPSAIIVASTDKVYGKPPASEMPMRDGSPLRPEHPYDVSKASADMIACSYGTYYGLPVAVTRCGNIYGPGDVNWDRLIPGTLRSMLLDRLPIIRSDGSQVREYNFVDDIVEAYIRLAETVIVGPPFSVPAGSAWTISNGDAFSVLEVVEACAEVVRRWFGITARPAMVLDQARDETPVLTLESRRFAEGFDWQPRTRGLDGLYATASWLQKWLTATGEMP